tara:strand:+ start:122 stop:289 length:168 start_codon:yes stop_codon:yes gene_type:complete
MDVNDPKILEKINNIIASDRLKKNEILQIVNLVSISKSIKELKDNLKWECIKPKH